MKIVCISDTHCKLNKIIVPEGEVLIHAGDLCSRGSRIEAEAEIKLLSKIAKNFDAHFFVPGNHDIIFEHDTIHMKAFCQSEGVNMLLHETATYKKFNIFGSPYTPEFFNWAFNVPRGEELYKKWQDIPLNTNILITHGPPSDMLDRIPDSYFNPLTNSRLNVGCEDLKNRISELKELKLHVFGHIHNSYGQKNKNGVKYINASICTEKYNPTNKPIVIEVK